MEIAGRTPNFAKSTFFTLVALSLVQFPAFAAVTFSSAGLNVSSGATGSEILNSGILVEANHVGNEGQATLTLDNGLTFGISLARFINPDGGFQAQWEGLPPYSTGWRHNSSDDRGRTFNNPAFNELMNHAWWIAYSASKSELEIGGLTIGHTYRLQLISENPASGTVSVEQSSEFVWSGADSLLTATWTAADDTLNMTLSRYLPNPLTGEGQGDEVFFQGYALHDMGVIPEPASALLNIIGLLSLLRRRQR